MSYKKVLTNTSISTTIGREHTKSQAARSLDPRVDIDLVSMAKGIAPFVSWPAIPVMSQMTQWLIWIELIIKRQHAYDLRGARQTAQYHQLYDLSSAPNRVTAIA